MLGRITFSLLLGVALLGAPIQLPANVCGGTPEPQKTIGCHGCCGTGGSCCFTSEKKTPLPAVPVSNNGNSQELAAVIATSAGIAIAILPYSGRQIVSAKESAAHSPPPLTLNCIRLI